MVRLSCTLFRKPDAQIRFVCTCGAEGTPVLGDPTYLIDGQRVANQTLTLTDPPMCLHAQRLSFRHPQTEGMRFTFNQADDPVWFGERESSSLSLVSTSSRQGCESNWYVVGRLSVARRVCGSLGSL